ncbi:MAG TPA: diphthine--ammonia ligase [Bacteroidia bacterium]|nr:diphthine--ammonia ligase [Bacteroidia bacterium]
MNLPKAIFCWSGGKDSALCLHKVLSGKMYDVKYLLTTVNDEFRRISMHGVREELLEAQAASVGIPLITVRVKEGTNDEYEKQMEAALLKAKAEGIGHVIFGDIFLEDLRVYREQNLAKVDLQAVFPLWKQDTSALLREFVQLGFRSVLCCTNDAFLGEEWVGKEIDGNFGEQLPANADPCGENGEYHSFCYDGPLFSRKINFERGEKIYRPLEVKTTDDCTLPSENRTKGFWFIDLLPGK